MPTVDQKAKRFNIKLDVQLVALNSSTLATAIEGKHARGALESEAQESSTYGAKLLVRARQSRRELGVVYV